MVLWKAANVSFILRERYTALSHSHTISQEAQQPREGLRTGLGPMFWSIVLCKSNTSVLKNGAAGLRGMSGRPHPCVISLQLKDVFFFLRKVSIKNAVAITGSFMERPGKR